MALTRFNGNVVPFASESTTDNRTVFGDVVQADDIDSNLNADFKKGWEIVGLNDNPTKQDFNAMGYTLGALTSYLYQMGIAEYNASQEYKLNAVCIGTDGTIYQSLVNANIGNALNNGTKWKNVTGSYVTLTGDQSIDGIKNFVKSPIVPTPTTNFQTATKKYVDDNSIGVGQTWQVVTSSRAFGITYTNTTGRARVVLIAVGATGSATTSNGVRLDVNGVAIAEQQAAPFASGGTTKPTINSLFSVIPAGSTYSLHIEAGSPKIYYWSELN